METITDMKDFAVNVIGFCLGAILIISAYLLFSFVIVQTSRIIYKIMESVNSGEKK